MNNDNLWIISIVAIVFMVATVFTISNFNNNEQYIVSEDGIVTNEQGNIVGQWFFNMFTTSSSSTTDTTPGLVTEFEPIENENQYVKDLLSAYNSKEYADWLRDSLTANEALLGMDKSYQYTEGFQNGLDKGRQISKRKSFVEGIDRAKNDYWHNMCIYMDENGNYQFIEDAYVNDIESMEYFGAINEYYNKHKDDLYDSPYTQTNINAGLGMLLTLIPEGSWCDCEGSTEYANTNDFYSMTGCPTGCNEYKKVKDFIDIEEDPFSDLGDIGLDTNDAWYDESNWYEGKDEVLENIEETGTFIGWAMNNAATEEVSDYSVGYEDGLAFGKGLTFLESFNQGHDYFMEKGRFCSYIYDGYYDYSEEDYMYELSFNLFLDRIDEMVEENIWYKRDSLGFPLAAKNYVEENNPYVGATIEVPIYEEGGLCDCIDGSMYWTLSDCNSECNLLKKIVGTKELTPPWN